jgi:hypothetical protein
MNIFIIIILFKQINSNMNQFQQVKISPETQIEQERIILFGQGRIRVIIREERIRFKITDIPRVITYQLWKLFDDGK